MPRLAVNILVILVLIVMAAAGCKSKDEPASLPENEQNTPEPEKKEEIKADKGVGFFKDNGFCMLAFNVKGGLIPSIKKVLPETEPYSEHIGAQLLKALIWDIDQRRDIRNGDQCRLVYKTTKDRFKIRVYGLEFHSKKFSKTYRYFFFWEADKKFPEYFTESGNAVARRMKNPPLKTFDEVISVFSQGSKSRDSIKYRVRTGTEVRMPYPAVVKRINWDIEKLGLSVEVNYPGTGMDAHFYHLSAISEKVLPGEHIPKGEVFARTGVSGDTQTPHLEYKLIQDTGEGPNPADPFKLHGEEPYMLPPSAYKDFVSVKYQILEKFRKVEFPPTK